MFKTVESFQKQITNLMKKVDLAGDNVVKAETKLEDAETAVFQRADEIRGEADALIVRANQINAMLDGLTNKA